MRKCIRTRGCLGTRALERIGCPSKLARTASTHYTHIGSRSYLATVYVLAREAIFCEHTRDLCYLPAPGGATCLFQAVSLYRTYLFQIVHIHSGGTCLLQTVRDGVV